ncbi:ARM repeat-containing protein [Hygrophoropsis aurantiaca]|uniref:ARM repeat-containing protein n=1 Tax=Hygrophoropsis aurantiaca TaxID=72124 RepID=A0ACB8A8G0_9AGAM|nr:ARM repeat-containing protein [Hygrophoropsis aurantiaca]
MPPPSELPRRRPGPLDLSKQTPGSMTPGPMSALATARHIEDLSAIEYPEGIKSPSVGLNAGVKDRKFRYDRDFLLQFMSICKEKPDHLPPLDVLGIEPVDQSTFAMSRGGSGRHRNASGALTPSATARQNSIGLGIGGFGGANAGGFAMGQFSTPTTKLSSEERFAMASGARSASVGSAAGMQFGRNAPMARTSSQGGPGHMTKRTRSKRGVDRSEGGGKPQGGQAFGGQGGHGGQGGGGGMGVGVGGVPLEPVAPLEVSANRWVAGSTSRKPAAEADSPELVDRKVKGLLNKLTMEKFGSISDQIIAWANKSQNESDGRTLIQVIRLVFEKATDEAAWSEMYARLCRKMMEQISAEVQDDGIRNAEGKPIAGGQLFRKYLLNRCQEDFERGWFAKEAAAAAAKVKASSDEATKAANDSAGADGETALYSDEYYVAQKAKRQGLGLIKFIGELFKLQMLTERIMHECVKKLLGNVENPEEEEIESLCQLLKTVGRILDNVKARAHMDVYFTRMRELGKSANVSSRMQFMLQDVIELRERKWVSRKEVAAPTTIAAVHEAAAKEKASAEKESYQRQLSMSRGGSRRGGERNNPEFGPDGWAVAGQARPPPKAGDLSNFGKINKAAPMTFGPSSVFAGKGGKDAVGGAGAGKRDSLSRTNSSQNMFSMLSQNPELAAEAGGAGKSRPGSRKGSVDFGQGGVPDAPGAVPPTRRKLQLLPRSRPTAEGTPAVSEDEPDATPTNDEMSDADAQKRVDEDVKEFFAVRNLGEADVYFANLTRGQRWRLVDKLVGAALESREADARLVGEFFARVRGKGDEVDTQVDAETFEAGFAPMVELLSDIAIDAPKAFEYMAIMMRGAGFGEEDGERLEKVAGKCEDGERLVRLVRAA